MTKEFILILVLTLLSFSCKEKNENTVSPEITVEQQENFYEAYYRLQATIPKKDYQFSDKGYPFRKASKADMYAFYKIVGNHPVWLNEDGINIHTWTFLEELKSADQHGLFPEEYFYNMPVIPNYDADKTVFNNLEPDQLVQLEYGLTWAYITLQKHLWSGRINPDTTVGLWRNKLQDTLVSSAIGKAFNSKDISGSLKHFIPKRENYHQLMDALAKYRQYEKNNGWPKIPENIPEEDSIKLWIMIAKRLAVTGQFEEKKKEIDSNLSIPKLKEALKKFQYAMGLKPDGLPGKETLEQLNKSAEYRVKQIVLNLERLRWEPRTLGEDYIMINIPEYKMHAYKNGKKQFEMKIIVGKYMTKTPIFSDTIEYVVFNPTWTVPMSIMKNEMLPRLRNGDIFLSREHFSLYNGYGSDANKINPYAVDWEDIQPSDFSFRIVQEPGPWNALGSVKFIFPNDMDIYLHDTPAEYLFQRTDRSFSHGCMRIEKPHYFAEYLLDKQLSNKEIQAKFDSYRTQTVMLENKVPVFITYHTAWVDEDGIVNFRKDIYRFDEIQYEAITPTYDRVAEKILKN